MQAILDRERLAQTARREHSERERQAITPLRDFSADTREHLDQSNLRRDGVLGGPFPGDLDSMTEPPKRIR